MPEYREISTIESTDIPENLEAAEIIAMFVSMGLEAKFVDNKLKITFVARLYQENRDYEFKELLRGASIYKASLPNSKNRKEL